MKNLKHTKGPWTNGWGTGLTGPTTITRHPTVSGEDLDYVPISKGRETLAAVIQQDNLSGKDEMKANAKLIAAAPELLEALNNLVNKFGSVKQVKELGIENELIDAINAINKATK